jgi:hypothetical protein
MIFNYIPHKSPKHPNFFLWYENYQEHLKRMFLETVEIINNNTDFIIDIETERNFNIFVNMIYNASSKYIEKDI